MENLQKLAEKALSCLGSWKTLFGKKYMVAHKKTEGTVSEVLIRKR